MDTAEAWEYWRLDPEEHALVAAEVADQAPEVFAICEIERDAANGDPVEGHVAAWGLVLPDRTVVVDAEPGYYGRFGSVDRAMTLYGRGTEVGIALPGGRSAMPS